MADFLVTSLVSYLNFDGAQNTSSDGSILLTTSATDDGTYDVGDERTSGSGYDFAGTFDDGGHTFLVFQGPANAFVHSVSADVADYPSTYKAGDFVLDVLPFPLCFAEGTMIATPDGDRAVQDLQIGEKVRAADGRIVNIKWIGRQMVLKLLAGPRMQPVRFRAGALGDGLPHTDLTVTADHGMIIDDLVINASALVNHDTIDFVPENELQDQVTYYHIETEDHDVILANGAAAETFVDAVTRASFDNYAEYLDLYGAERIIPEMDRPRVSSRRLVPQAVRDRLGIGADRREFADLSMA